MQTQYPFEGTDCDLSKKMAIPLSARALISKNTIYSFLARSNCLERLWMISSPFLVKRDITKSQSCWLFIWSQSLAPLLMSCLLFAFSSLEV